MNSADGFINKLIDGFLSDQICSLGKIQSSVYEFLCSEFRRVHLLNTSQRSIYVMENSTSFNLFIQRKK
jgi:hypothetical protein